MNMAPSLVAYVRSGLHHRAAVGCGRCHLQGLSCVRPALLDSWCDHNQALLVNQDLRVSCVRLDFDRLKSSSRLRAPAEDLVQAPHFACAHEAAVRLQDALQFDTQVQLELLLEVLSIHPLALDTTLSPYMYACMSLLRCQWMHGLQTPAANPTCPSSSWC